MYAERASCLAQYRKKIGKIGRRAHEPRRTRHWFEASNPSDVHCHTFPIMFQGPFGGSPPSWGTGEIVSSPHGKIRLSVPRAARSHSTSVGSRFPAHSQYATASDHVTLTTGSFSVPFSTLPGQWGGIGCPVSARKHQYS